MQSVVVRNTTYASIAVQVLTGIIGALGLFVHVDDAHRALRDALVVETVVQLVELCVYILLVTIASSSTGMLKMRYYDWVITTPIMLLTTLVYVEYRVALHEGRDPGSMKDILARNKVSAILMTALNLGMLAAGYLGESGVVSISVANPIGFAFFIGAFAVLWRHAKTTTTRVLVGLMTGLWGMYGVAFYFDADTKNIWYNGLDILAKNFFGVFLAIELYRVRNTRTLMTGIQLKNKDD